MYICGNTSVSPVIRLSFLTILGGFGLGKCHGSGTYSITGFVPERVKDGYVDCEFQSPPLYCMTRHSVCTTLVSVSDCGSRWPAFACFLFALPIYEKMS